MKEPILIIAPHPDDEAYGCSSIMKNASGGLLVVYVTSLHPLFPDGENIQEQAQVTTKVQFTPLFMNPHHAETNILDKAGQLSLIEEFERTMNEYKPETVLIPCPSYNQDHRAVYDAALTAMRPHDRNHFVKCILLYEQPETFGTLRKPDAIRPNYFIELDLNFKLTLISVYKSQMRGHRTPDHIEAIARIRGMQANMEFAEAFEVARWIE